MHERPNRRTCFVLINSCSALAQDIQFYPLGKHLLDTTLSTTSKKFELTFSVLSHTPVVRGKLCTFSDWWKTSKGGQVNLYFTRILETCLGQRANVPYMYAAVQDREAN